MPRRRWPTVKSFSKSSKKNNLTVQIPIDEPLVPLGEIVATHGLLGWLKLNPFNPETTALKPGAEVFTTAGERVGIVQSTMATSGGELYIVHSGSKEHLIPAVKEIVDKIDFANRTVTIDPPAGLLEL